MTKTAAELAALKRNWMDDPCWDIEHTEGFEAHKKDLLIFRLERDLKTAESQLAEYRECFARMRNLMGL